jgi:hypothetical protein
VVAANTVTVTLARAWDAAEQAAQAGLITFVVALDAQGMPDAAAWLDDPEPWPASLVRDGEAPLQGDVALDEDGWQLRFFVAGGTDPDAPAHRLLHLGGGLRPGEVLTLRAPEGEEAAWRVVGVQPRGT